MFSPVMKRINRNNCNDIKESSSGERSPVMLSRLEQLKSQNSFINMNVNLNSPQRSPDKASAEEPCTPKNKLLPPKRELSGITPLSVDIINKGAESADSDFVLSPEPSPIISFHHNFKDKHKPPENKAYRYACAAEVSRQVSVGGVGSGSSNDRRHHKNKSKQSNKRITYSAEYLRPIEEFIYPSLRPDKEMAASKRLEAKKNMDFSLSDVAEPVELNLQWTIHEAESLEVKPDLSSSLLDTIGAKGEAKLRDVLSTTCLKRIKREGEIKRMDEKLDFSSGFLRGARKGNVMGNLFAKPEKGLAAEAAKINAESSGNPNDVYYGLYKKTKSRVDTAEMLSARRIVALSRVEVSYHDSKEQLGRTLPGFDENNDHFNGLIYYQIKNATSERKVNTMLTNCVSPLAAAASRESFDSGAELGQPHNREKVLNTSSIARRQSKFQSQRVGSSVCLDDPEETHKMLAEYARMAAALPLASLGSEYSLNVLSRIKRASRAIHNNEDVSHFSGQGAERADSIGSDDWDVNTVEQRKRFAQDSLLFREIKAGLIPEQLLKKIPRMGALVSLDLSHFSLGDELCCCLGKSLVGLEMLHTLGLRSNRLTFTGINAVLTHVNMKAFRHLDLSMNDVSGSAVPTLCDMLMRPDNKLSSLELESTQLTRQHVVQLCKAISYPETSWIMELSLARNSLGFKAMRAVAELLKYPGCSLSWLDLSWNSFDAESGACLSEALLVNQTLTSLDMSANSLRDAGGQRLAASLLQNKNLREVSLSLNNIGGKSCFIFSKVLRGHPSMSRLNLSDNPLTDAGARSIFRTILRGLKCFVMMQNCTFLTARGLFNHSNPSLDSPYSIDLAEPYEVAVLSELIHMVNVNNLCRFSHLTYREKAGDAKCTDISVEVVEEETFLTTGSTPWAIPSSGVLKLHLTHQPPIPTLDMAIDELAYNTILAIVVNARSENDRKNWLFLMCMDAFFTSEQAQDLIDILADHHLIGGGGVSIVEFFCCIWSNIIDVVNLYDFYHRNLDESKRLSLLYSLSFEKFRFNWVNPSGHWRLDLANKVQRSVMMQLIALNGSESKASKRAKRGDTSQKGNYCNFRNEQLSGVEVEVNTEYTKSLPWTGVLEFDYVSTTRMPPSTAVISEEEFVRLLHKLEISPRRRLGTTRSNIKLLELQLAVAKYYFSPDLIYKIMNCFAEDTNTQVRVIVCMFGRLVDLHDFDIVLRHVSAAAIQDVLNRIGVLNCLNPLKPCLDLCLKLKYRDNRILVHSYLQMSSAEGGDQLKQHPRSDLDIIALYAQLGRLIGDTIDGTLMFTYCEVGEREAPLDWKLRKDMIQHFLVGNQPRSAKMMKIVQMYKEIKNAGVLTLGPLDIQYGDYTRTLR